MYVYRICIIKCLASLKFQFRDRQSRGRKIEDRGIVSKMRSEFKKRRRILRFDEKNRNIRRYKNIQQYFSCWFNSCIPNRKRLLSSRAQKLNYPLSIHHEHTSGATKTTLLRDKRELAEHMEI